MSIRKPLKESTITEEEIEKMISKGAFCIEDKDITLPSSENTHTFIRLRIPINMLKSIDERVTLGSRTLWILQAIQNRLNNKE